VSAFAPGQELLVIITREPFSDYFTLHLPNGHTEELEPDEARKWFKDHGVNDDEGLEHCLDMCWNFYKHEVLIDAYVEPAVANPRYAPQV
jgi:hypothetical protein